MKRDKSYATGSDRRFVSAAQMSVLQWFVDKRGGVDLRGGPSQVKALVFGLGVDEEDVELLVRKGALIRQRSSLRGAESCDDFVSPVMDRVHELMAGERARVIDIANDRQRRFDEDKKMTLFTGCEARRQK